MGKPLNIYVDDDAGTTYRACFVAGNVDTIHGVMILRRASGGHDVGRPLKRTGAKFKALLAKARTQAGA